MAGHHETGDAEKPEYFCQRFKLDEITVENAPDYAMGWGSLAMVNAGIAQGKNRSGLNWFVVSIFLGPVATFLLVALFEKEK